jgi:hypothetical protein
VIKTPGVDRTSRRVPFGRTPRSQVLHCLQSKADVYAEDILGQSFLAASLL